MSKKRKKNGRVEGEGREGQGRRGGGRGGGKGGSCLHQWPLSFIFQIRINSVTRHAV